MRTRATALAAVAAFALVIATVAVLAGRGGQELVKLPVGSGGAAGAEDAASTSARSAMLAPEFGGVEYRVGTLPDLPSSAPAYRLPATTTEADVRRLAAVFGLDGAVRQEEGGWVLRAGDRELRVERSPGLPWYLGTVCPEQPVPSDPPVDKIAVACGVAGGGVAGSSGAVDLYAPSRPAPDSVTPVAVAPDPSAPPCAGGTADCASVAPTEPAPAPAPFPVPAPEPPPRPADLPTKEAAERLARDLFTRLGVGTEGFALEDGWATWEARIEPRVDGLPVFGLWHSLSVGPKAEVVRANGFLGRPDRIGDYPLVGLEKGIERLRGDVGIGPRPLVAEDVETLRRQDEQSAASAAGSAGVAAGEKPLPGDAGSAGADCSDPTVTCSPPPDAPVPPDAPPTVRPEPVEPPPPVVRTITGAHLALMQVDAVLVPVYVFEFDEGGESFPVPAVTDEWLEAQAPSVEGKRD